MKLYLETTVPNFLITEQSPEKRAITERFFVWLRRTNDDLFVSVLVEEELRRAPEPKRTQLLRAFHGIPLTILDVTDEARGLAKVYVEARIVPERYRNDARHVAIAVCHGLDVVVSWNMEHLVNVRKVERINQINLRYGLPAIRIHTPEEVMDS